MRQLTWIGHSTVLVDLDGVRLLTDPLLRNRVAHLRRLEPVDLEVLGRVDAVLVSHGHYDHLDIPSLRRLDPAVPVVAPRGLAPALRRAGRERIVEVDEGEEIRFGDVNVRATPAHHPGGPQLRKGAAVGFAISGSSSIYFAGDTDLFDEMRALAGRFDVALLPVWGWGPSLGPGHMDPLSAAHAVALVRPRVAVPIHWGTFFPVGLEALRGSALVEPPRVFARHVAELAPEVEVRVLAPGDALVLGRVAM
jgi:L-ascorbate metabolism protein UlaG (beta-lactamase superfamily)